MSWGGEAKGIDDANELEWLEELWRKREEDDTSVVYSRGEDAVTRAVIKKMIIRDSIVEFFKDVKRDNEERRINGGIEITGYISLNQIMLALDDHIKKDMMGVNKELLDYFYVEDIAKEYLKGFIKDLLKNNNFWQQEVESKVGAIRWNNLKNKIKTNIPALDLEDEYVKEIISSLLEEKDKKKGDAFQRYTQNKAVTTIASAARGRKTRKKVKGMNKAATTIAAVARGRRTRKKKEELERRVEIATADRERHGRLRLEVPATVRDTTSLHNERKKLAQQLGLSLGHIDYTKKGGKKTRRRKRRKKTRRKRTRRKRRKKRRKTKRR